MIKRAPSLVEQVQSHLRQRISNAEFDDGRIPSETDLAGDLNVSRNTVRDALSRLEAEGIIYRRQGAGTFVNQAVHLVKTRLEEIVPYESLIEQQGYTPTVKLLRAAEQPADAETRQTLRLKPGAPVLEIRKLYLAGSESVIFSRTRLPVTALAAPYTATDLRLPVFEMLPRLCRQELGYYLSELLPVLATEELSATLNLPEACTALLSFSETGFTPDNTPILRAQSWFRSDLLRLQLIRRAPQRL